MKRSCHLCASAHSRQSIANDCSLTNRGACFEDGWPRLLRRHGALEFRGPVEHDVQFC
jgi:hypothetical protein